MRNRTIIILAAMLSLGGVARPQAPSVPLSPDLSTMPTPVPPPQTVTGTPAVPLGNPAAVAVPKSAPSARKTKAKARPRTPPSGVAPSGIGAPTQPPPAPQSTPQQRPRNDMMKNAQIPLSVQLDRIRMTRIVDFKRGAAAPAKTKPGLEGVSLDDLSWRPEMTIQIRAVAPRDWDVISVDEVKFLGVKDQNGAPITLQPMTGLLSESPAPNLNPEPPQWARTDNGVIVQPVFHPPAPEVTALREMSAQVKLTMGRKKVVRIQNIAAQVGKTVVSDMTNGDLIMQVAEAAGDQLSVDGFGNLDRVGSISFEDAGGHPVNIVKDSSEIKDNPELSDKKLKQMNFTFEKGVLSNPLTMVVEYYTTILPSRSYKVEWKNNINLP